MGRIGKEELDPELLELIEKLAEPPTFLENYYTIEEIDKFKAEVNNYLDMVLTVDKTYTKDIIDYKLGLINDKVNTINGINSYTKQEIDDKINILKSVISNKIDSNTIYTKQEVQDLVNETINKLIPDMSVYYTKDEVDQKTDELIKTTDIIDNLTSSSTTNPVSSNQIKILNDKIDNLKITASDRLNKVATAISSIGINLGSDVTWDKCNTSLKEFQKPITEDMFYTRKPKDLIELVNFKTLLGSELKDNIILSEFDKYTDNWYIITQSKCIILNSSFELISNIDISLPNICSNPNSTYATYRCNKIIITENLIYLPNYILNKHTLEILLCDNIYPLYQYNGDSVICAYFSEASRQSSTSQWNCYISFWCLENIDISNKITIPYMTYSNRIYVNFNPFVDSSCEFFISGNKLYCMFLHENFYISEVDNVYGVLTFIRERNDNYIINDGTLLLSSNYRNINNIIYGQKCYMTINDCNVTKYDSSITNVLSYNTNNTSDGVSDILYDFNFSKFRAIYNNSILWEYDCTFNNGSNKLSYNDMCEIYNETNTLLTINRYGVYRLTFKEK